MRAELVRVDALAQERLYEIDRLGAERDRLREALRRIADVGTGIPDWRTLCDYARAALAADTEGDE
jgi:hypothetical protein